MCIFCQIASHQQPTDFVYEDDRLVAFNDINPKAPVHLLIVPKKHIQSVDRLEEQDKELIGRMVLLAKKLAREKNIAEKGYRLIINVGRGGGQLVDHLHLHLMGGGKL